MLLYIVLVLILMIPILAIVLDSRVGQALASRLERRGLQGSEELLADRVAFLEGEVERLNAELLRLDEESDFLQELLAERQGRSGARLPGSGGAGVGALPRSGPDGPGGEDEGGEGPERPGPDPEEESGAGERRG